ncbi:MAG TPA: carbamoyltransferase N-terminal domain-containing protein [Puia sp.]|uniref:carbamoyltransferase N-terminal domain-containing protein n=1 Tax=Puia sp. TaxID=2045100 RepID=UPI002C798B63|nr:carbamoyltransferase N-terminal domain-containing protein [Puia sp.]HVU95239.1 carbamoyltransferase N-terminal domain-containing protein [Puia sp.]
MLICGLKLTHDGAVALLQDNRLLFSIEMEKIGNNDRYSAIEDIRDVEQLLAREGFTLSGIDEFVVDGWGGDDADALAVQPRLQITAENNFLSLLNFGREAELPVARYQEKTLASDVLEEFRFNRLPYKGAQLPYSSFLHVTGHLMSAYATSPFAAKKEPAFLLIWDGGMYPRLYHFDPAVNTMTNLGPLFLMIGNMYSIFAQHFGPFRVKGNFAKDSLSVAGKVMAYIALGKVQPELFKKMDDVYYEHYETPMGFANVFTNEFKKSIEGCDIPDENILATFHDYLGSMLVEKLGQKLSRTPLKAGNLCLAGGCALNIKWNSQIRQSGLFRQVYVPPFPNDSGSAIGMAAALLYKRTGLTCLDWNVYGGPALGRPSAPEGWQPRACSLKELASLLHHSGEPVVFLNGRAELGPRALGNRSILASPASPGMKDILNDIKQREHYRPVSPICLEEYAADIFSPGHADPYMLFDHQVRRQWLHRIPAVTHLDGSARLQTVNSSQNPEIHELLMHFCAESGIPLLCNTSANFHGKGFFPDVTSAAAWAGTNYIWSDCTLFERTSRLLRQPTEQHAAQIA